MATGPKFKHNWSGYRDIMRSDTMAADLLARARRVANAAEQDPQVDDLIVDTTIGRNRAGATVLGVPMRVETASRPLGRAIDAAG